MTQENYGTYECISKEKNYTKVVKNYHLTEQKIPEPMTDRGNTPRQYNMNDASAVVPQMWINLGLAVTVMGIFR